jgi:hypothetical protein
MDAKGRDGKRGDAVVWRNPSRACQCEQALCRKRRLMLNISLQVINSVFGCCPSRLFVVIVVVVPVVVVMAVDNHYHLRLSRIRYRDAE